MTGRLFGGAGDDKLDGGTTKKQDVLDGGDGTDRCRNGRIVRDCEIVV